MRAVALARVEHKRMRIVAGLGHDGGLWSWKSSPHVLWLAAALAGHA